MNSVTCIECGWEIIPVHTINPVTNESIVTTVHRANGLAACTFNSNIPEPPDDIMSGNFF